MCVCVCMWPPWWLRWGLLAMQETPGSIQEDPLQKGIATPSSILAWKIPEQRSLVGCNPWGCKESDMTKRLKTYSSLGVVNTDIFVYITGKIYFLWITSFYKKF